MPINELIAAGIKTRPTMFYDEQAKAQQVSDINAINKEKIAQAGQETRVGANKEALSNIILGGAGFNQAQPVAAAPANPQPTQEVVDRSVLVKDTFNKLPERDMRRVESIIQAGDELTPFVQADDKEGAIKYLDERKKMLGGKMASGEDINTIDTDEARQQIKSGDWAGFKQTHAGLIEAGQLLGLLKTPDAANVGGGTGVLVNRLMKENPKLSFNDALAQVQTGYRTGVNIQGGQATPIPGLGESKGVLKEQETAGAKRAELQYEPTIEGNKAKSKSDSEFRAKAQQNLPKALDNAEYLDTQLQALIDSPGKTQAVGLSSLVPIIPGTAAADFKARLDQVGGEQFLQAFESLKGGGQITEIEGQKATEAIARMQRSQTEKEFDKSVKEFQGIVKKATERARAAAGSNNDRKYPAEQAAALLPPEENIPNGGNLAANVGLPKGALQIGTSGGKPVFQTPDGRKFIQD